MGTLAATEVETPNFVEAQEHFHGTALPLRRQ